MKKVFVGFGFGAIQGGLFLYEAFRSGRFSRFVVAEVMPEVVAAVRSGHNRYWVNVATEAGIERHAVPGIEIYNPAVADDCAALVAAVSQADEIATALPSVKFFGAGEPGSVVDIVCAGLRQRVDRKDQQRTIIYTAENHNHAAEILAEKLLKQWRLPMAEFKARAQCLNTVIGKMSGVVTDKAQITRQGLTPMTGDAGRCFLVETFNRILITRIQWPDFQRGIEVFEEKDDLLPFEEAKLYGHNATHALMGYLGRLKGYAFMADIRNDRELTALARDAFLEESGRALCARHRDLDPLFTKTGYQAYADDLLKRMLNPYLCDAVDRVVRDPQRKLGWEDRLVGTMRVVLSQHITPHRYAQGARAALRMLQEQAGEQPERILDQLWAEANPDKIEMQAIKSLILPDQVDRL